MQVNTTFAFCCLDGAASSQAGSGQGEDSSAGAEQRAAEVRTGEEAT